MISVICLVFTLLVISYSAAVSYNQPKFSVCASWNLNATTFADNYTIGQRSTGIFINVQNTIYVADGENGRVLIWHNGSSRPTKNIRGDLINPWSLFVTIQGDIFVDNGNPNNRIDKWMANETNSKSVMHANGTCTGLFVDINNNLYCSLRNHHRVVKVDLSSDLHITATVAGTGCPGPVSNMLDHPHGIFVDISFDLYVADSHNNRIQRLVPNQMNAITVAGFGASFFCLLNRPTDIVLDADGYLFIVDSHNHRIVRSTLDGFQCLVGCSSESGATSSQMHNPQTMAFDNNGNIFVTDLNNHRIQKFILATNSCGCSSSNQAVLLLTDTNTAAIQTLINSLQHAGLTVNYISGGISTYNGSASASSYCTVILMTGNNEQLDMPSSGQQSIVNAQQNNGTGIVMTEWAAYHVLSSRWTILSSLLLAPRQTGIAKVMSFSLVNNGHPIWTGLPSSFTSTGTISYSELGPPTNGSTVIANCVVCGGPAVIVRPSLVPSGRIVQIAHAGHYSNSASQFTWGNDLNLLTMMVNAVKWAAQLS